MMAQVNPAQELRLDNSQLRGGKYFRAVAGNVQFHAGIPEIGIGN